MNILSISVYGDITLSDILIFLIVVSFSIIFAHLLKTYMRRMLKGRITHDLLNILEKIVYYAIIVVGTISALPQIGVNLTGLLVAGGIAGIVIGFASQSVVTNLISGIFLIFERPIKINDQISVGDISGVVEDIRVLSTIVRTYEGIYVRIPNEKIFSSNIVNYVMNPVRRFEYTVGVSYSDDAEAVKIIRKILEDHPFVLRTPSPDVFVDRLGENSVIITVRVWAPSSVWYGVKMELLQTIKEELDRAGVTFPLPQRVIHFEESEET